MRKRVPYEKKKTSGGIVKMKLLKQWSVVALAS